MAKNKMNEELKNRLGRSLERQIKGVLSATKLADDAHYGDNFKEMLTWFQNAQSCLTQATEITCELRDGH